MPKKHRHFRFSDAAEQALTTYSIKWNCTPTEALERLLLRWRYLDDIGFREFQETLNDEINCSVRIRHKGLFYCMHSVPQNVNIDRRLIETLDICRVCRRRKIGLTEKTQTSHFLASMSNERSAPGESFENKVAGQADQEQRKEEITSVTTPSPFKPSSPPEPTPHSTFSCPILKNRSYCLANPCEHRKQCREVGRIPNG